MVEGKIITLRDIDVDAYGHLNNSKYSRYFLPFELDALSRTPFAGYHLAISQTWFKKEVIPGDNLSIESIVRKLHGDIIILDDEKKTKTKQKRAVQIQSTLRQDKDALAVRKAIYGINFPEEKSMEQRIEQIKRRASNEYQKTPEIGFFQGRGLLPEVYEQLFGEGVKDLLRQRGLLPRDLLPENLGFLVVHSKYSYFRDVIIPAQVEKDAEIPLYFTVTSGIRFSRYTANAYAYIESVLKANGEVIGIGETRNCFVRIEEDGAKKMIIKPQKDLIEKVSRKNGSEHRILREE